MKSARRCGSLLVSSEVSPGQAQRRQSRPPVLWRAPRVRALTRGMPVGGAGSWQRVLVRPLGTWNVIRRCRPHSDGAREDSRPTFRFRRLRNIFPARVCFQHQRCDLSQPRASAAPPWVRPTKYHGEPQRGELIRIAPAPSAPLRGWGRDSWESLPRAPLGEAPSCTLG